MDRVEQPINFEPTFDDSFDELAALAYRVGFRLLGDRAEAEDVAQETLARAYVRWRRVSHYPEAWVTRVATNVALDRLRGRQRLRRSTTSAAIGSIGQSDDAHAAERLDLARHVAALPRRQRQVVALRYLADMSEGEVARQLGCSPGSVKRHAHRAVTTLRALHHEGGI